ncbi:MAG: hypothetical protein HOP06_04585 [Methylotenera sp.]|nr:hypothetical protein [Methylotenera sp.]
MKAGWQVKPLAAISKLFADGDWIESKDQSADGVRLVQTGNVGEGFFKDRGEKARYISKETFVRLRCTEIFEGDCLISRLPDPVGRSCLLPDTGERMITAVDCTIVRFDSSQFLPDLFVYYTQSSDYLNNVDKETSGTTRKRISRSKLGEISIPVPPIEQQQRIVAILDQAFEGIAKARANAEQNLQNARALFESHLQSVFQNKSWIRTSVEEACTEIFAGGDAPKEKFSLKKNEEFTIPIFANAIKDNGLYGYTNFARVTKPSVTISARGSGTGHTEIRFESFLPIVRLIVLIPNSSLINLEFLKYSIDNLEILRSGSAIPQLTVPMIKEYHIPLPTLPEQLEIISQLEILFAETQRLEALYQRKIACLDELKKSLLQQAFAGEL